MSKKGAIVPAADDSDEEFDVGGAEGKAALLAALKSNNPALVMALQSKLDGLVGRDSGYLDSLPGKARCTCSRRRRHACTCARAGLCAVLALPRVPARLCTPLALPRRPAR